MNLQAPQLPVPDKVIAPEDASAVADPLADALLYLAAHHGRSISREALLAGLPIIDGKLNASLLERAARKAGLEIEPVKRSLVGHSRARAARLADDAGRHHPRAPGNRS